MKIYIADLKKITIFVCVWGGGELELPIFLKLEYLYSTSADVW